MAEHTYVLPKDGNGAGSSPTLAKEDHQMANEVATLLEMNAKLDAILTALGRKEK